MPASPSIHGGKVNGRNGPIFSSSSSMIPSSGHHSKQRPPSPVSRDEEKRRTVDDKWKSGNSEKLLRDRVLSQRGQAFDETSHETILSKHSLSSRLSKNTHAPSLDYVRAKNPPEPPEPSLSKKRSKEKTIDKVKRHIMNFVIPKYIFKHYE